jgi:hypothetical protein
LSIRAWSPEGSSGWRLRPEQSENEADQPTYLRDDALGSVRGLTDSAGSLTGTADYDVFGQVRASSGASSVFGFSGEQFDPETGFIFRRARYLDPRLGQRAALSLPVRQRAV